MNYPIVMRLKKRFDPNFKTKVKKEADIWADHFLLLGDVLLEDRDKGLEVVSQWLLDHYHIWEKYTMRQCLALGVEFESYLKACNGEIVPIPVNIGSQEGKWKKAFESFSWDFYACSVHMTPSNIFFFIVQYNYFLISKRKIERKNNSD